MSDYVAGGRSERLARRGGSGVGMWGMAMLVASEATLFGTFIGTDVYLRFVNRHWPPPGTLEPRVVVPLVLAGVLATSSLPMWLAARAVRAGRLGATRAFIVFALLVQCGYFAYEVHDYAHQLHSSTPQANAYSSIYFTLLGADHAHVFVGILLSVWLLWKLAGGLTHYRRNAVRVVSFYWHAVNVLTLVVIGVLTSAAI